MDPGWVFFPADLKYFIRFEEHDYNRRLEAAKKGERVPRECPTGQMYREHQGSDGLYKRVFLRPFLSPLINLPNTPLPWEGAPLVAIRRAILCLGYA
jgi:hypothetical protein